MLELLGQPLRYFAIYVTAMTGIETLHLTIWALVFGCMLLVMAILAHRHARQARWNRLAAICAALAIGMNVSYEAMAGAVPAVRQIRYDQYLLAIDRFLIGGTPSQYMQPLVTPWLTDLMSLCYMLFMPLLFFNLLRYFFRRRELLGEFYSGIFTIYGLGFLGYLLVPAAGPWLAYPDLFSVNLDGGMLTTLGQTMVVKGSNRVDVWPSLHCAVSMFILGFAWRHQRKEFWLLLLPIIGLWMSTFYLRYHYFIDVICGFALAGFALYESRRHSKTVVTNTESATYVTDY